MRTTQQIRRLNDKYETLEDKLLSWESDSEALIQEMQECIEDIMDLSSDECLTLYKKKWKRQSTTK